MTPQQIEAALAASLADRRLSRGERQALGAAFASLTADGRESARAGAFALAREALVGEDSAIVLEWLEGVVKALREAGSSPSQAGRLAEAHFSPGDDCPRAIDRLLRGARHSMDICVFTITDDRLAEAILDAHRREVAIRILTDDMKADDLGSDVDRLAQAGISLRVDRSPSHMHHKFAIADGHTLLTGSYNWTRGAARDNEENLILTDEPRLVSSFARAFERLWDKVG